MLSQSLLGRCVSTKMASFAIYLFIFQTLFHYSLSVGDFVGDVKVKYNVFTVMESGSFQIECEATHEDKRPQLRWFVVNSNFRRRNLTSFTEKSGTGKTARDTLRKSGVSFSDAGDYYCEAKVEENLRDPQIKQSAGVPITVISEEKKPRVEASKNLQRTGGYVYTCKVVPVGIGDLTWYIDDDKVLEKKKVSQLDLESKSTGEFKCVGNLTIGGYAFFRSWDTTSGCISVLASAFSKMTYFIIACLVFLLTTVYNPIVS